MASFSYGFDSSDDGGDGYSGSNLASQLIGIGGSLAQTALEVNANPTNVALLQGQAVQTPTLSTSGVPTVAAGSISTSGLLFVALAGIVLFFIARG